MYEEPKVWYCSRCKKNIPNCIDIDYHINVEHPGNDGFFISMIEKIGT